MHRRHLLDWPGELRQQRKKLRFFDVDRSSRRHLPFGIASAERDQWLMCMQLAFDECIPDSPLRARLWGAIEGLADHMRNRADPA
jgi:hemoglobin